MLSLQKYASNIQNFYSAYITTHITISGRETEAQRQDHPACSKVPRKSLLETGREPRFLKSSFRISLSSSVNEHTGHYAVENNTANVERIGYLY